MPDDVFTMRAAAPEMRQVLLLVESLKKAGVLFVPLPILSTADKEALLAELFRRIELIEGKHFVVSPKR
jgi:hypothetical protein